MTASTGLQPVDAVIRSSRHQLDNEASGLADRVILIHKDSQSYRGRNLLRGGVIVRQILGDLTGNQNGLAHIGLL